MTTAGTEPDWEVFEHLDAAPAEVSDWPRAGQPAPTPHLEDVHAVPLAAAEAADVHAELAARTVQHPQPTIAGFLRWCVGEVGVQEQPRGSNHQPFAVLSGLADRQPWCAEFLVAGAKVTGLRLPAGAVTAFTPTLEAAFKRAGRLSATPRPGAWGFLYFPSMGRVAHTFTVTRVSPDGRWIWTVEGNSNTDGSREGYAVVQKKRPAHRAVGQVGARSYGMPFYVKEQAVDLTPKNLTDIAQAVLTAELIPNRNATKEGEKWSLLSMVSQMEDQQDTDSARLKQVEKLVANLAGSGATGATVDIPALAAALADVLAARLKK